MCLQGRALAFGLYKVHKILWSGPETYRKRSMLLNGCHSLSAYYCMACNWCYKHKIGRKKIFISVLGSLSFVVTSGSEESWQMTQMVISWMFPGDHWKDDMKEEGSGLGPTAWKLLIFFHLTHTVSIFYFFTLMNQLWSTALSWRK